MSYTPLRQADAYIRSLLPFTGNSLRAHRVPPMTDISLGMLNDTDRRRLELDNQLDYVYVVWSYDTPIAWYTSPGNWNVVTQKFSRTTSRHQSVVRRALSPALAA